MKKAQFLLIILIIITLLAISHFPDWYGYIKTPIGFWYAGHTSWFDPWDINFHFAVIRFGAKNGWLYQNSYTLEAHAPMPI